MEQFTKTPIGNWPIAFDFSRINKLPAGLTLVSGTVSAVRLDTGAVDNTVLGSTSLVINGARAIMRVQGGVSGVDYKISAVIVLSDGLTVLDEYVLMQVDSL